jgi:hypothetical protein
VEKVKNADLVSSTKGFFKYLETQPAMPRILTADELSLAGTRQPHGEPSTCVVAASGGGGEDLVGLVDEEGEDDATTAVALAHPPGQLRASEEVETLCRERVEQSSISWTECCSYILHLRRNLGLD